MQRPKLFLLASLAAAFTAVVWSVQASADIVFGDLGPNHTYGGAVFYPVDNVETLIVETAAPFTPSGNFTLTQIDVGIIHGSGTNSVLLSVEGANADGLPDGRPLASFTLTGLPFNSECPLSETKCVIQPDQMGKATSPVELFKGTEYWLVAGASSNISINDWRGDTIGARGPVAFNTGHGFELAPLTTSPAFAVLGTPVSAPEPAMLGLMALGLLGAGFSGRTRRN
jgi:hypothetical protein